MVAFLAAFVSQLKLFSEELTRVEYQKKVHWMILIVGTTLAIIAVFVFLVRVERSGDSYFSASGNSGELAPKKVFEEVNGAQYAIVNNCRYDGEDNYGNEVSKDENKEMANS